MAGATHLAKRFFGSLSPRAPRPEDVAWVADTLLPAEHELWRRMSRADPRHAAGVARRVERALGAEATRPVLAAALLHDVGKVTSGLGTYGRVVATLAGAAAGRESADVWSKTKGITRRVGLYLRHAPLGAELLELAGSEPLTFTWARVHHLPPDEWTLPRHLADALKAADDD
jgi:hypothetical protein